MCSLAIVSTTLEYKNDCEEIARLFLSEKIIACAQVSGPITSYYPWRGTVETSTEFSLSLKTTSALRERVKLRLKELHPYELPEIIDQTVTGASIEYMEWVEKEVTE